MSLQQPTGEGVPAVMGVLNITPDSFSDGGRYESLDDAVGRVDQMIAEGATFIDVGGESTRPGAGPVDPDEECRRVIPVIEAVAASCADAGVRISIDTRNEVTARLAVAAGADLINDVSASLWQVAADLGVGWVAMHMAGDPRTMQDHPEYGDVVEEVRKFLLERAGIARDHGVDEIWIDPGIGFGKTTAHNLELLGRLDRLVGEGFPVLVATSRKRFTGELTARSDLGPHGRSDPSPQAETPVSTPLVDVQERLDASLATATWAMVNGVEMVRAHDVGPTVQSAVVVAGGFAGR